MTSLAAPSQPGGPLIISTNFTPCSSLACFSSSGDIWASTFFSFTVSSRPSSPAARLNVSFRDTAFFGKPAPCPMIISYLRPLGLSLATGLAIDPKFSSSVSSSLSLPRPSSPSSLLRLPAKACRMSSVFPAAFGGPAGGLPVGFVSPPSDVVLAFFCARSSCFAIRFAAATFRASWSFAEISFPAFFMISKKKLGSSIRSNHF